MAVPDEPARQWVVEGFDAVQVVHLTFEPAGRVGQCGQGGDGRVGRVDGYVQLDAAVGVGGGEQVDGAQSVMVVVCGDEGEAEAAVEQGRGVRREVGGGGVDDDPVVPGGPACR